MANTIISVKKSGSPGATPSSLIHGELGINYNDGKLYYRNSSNNISSIYTANSYSVISANSSLLLASNPNDILTINPSGAIDITTDVFADTINIGVRKASTSQNGVVQLYSGTNSTSVDLAATANSVNTTYNVAVAAFNQANTGVIQAQAAFSAANNEPIAKSAFNQANNAFSKANSAITLGTTNLYLGSTNTSISGLISVSSNTLTLIGNTSSVNTSTGTLVVTGGVGISGALNATTKSFDIEHPSDPNKRLRYGSLESPSHSVRLTGKGSVFKGRGIIRLPEYFKDLVHKEEINIQITNIRHGEILWVEEERIEENYFVVGCNSEEDLEFYWSLTAERSDVEKLIVEY